METVEWIKSGILLATVVGLFFSLRYNRKQLKAYNKNLKLNFFADYTKRYQEIILNFPESINRSDFEFDQLEENVRNITMRYMRAYFDLCSEEYDLKRAGYIEDSIWDYWKLGIEFAYSKRAFRDAWGIIKLDTIYYPEFSSWIERIVTEKNRINNTR